MINFTTPNGHPHPKKITRVSTEGVKGAAQRRVKKQKTCPLAITRSVRTRFVLFITEYGDARQPDASPPIKLSRKEKLFRYGLVFA